MYWYDKETGNWTKYTLTATGSLDSSVQQVKAEDGFGVQHQTVLRFEATQAQFIIKYQDHEDTDITVNGNLEIKSYSYIDIESRKRIKSITDGHVEVSQLPQATIPIPLEFDGTLRSYPDPHIEPAPNLDEQVYEGDVVSSPEIERGDSGSISAALSDEEDIILQDYAWEVEAAERISGYDTLKINVTNKFWNFLDFQRTVWIANEVPSAVKLYLKTNSSWDDENSTGHIIIENTRTIREDGYTPGSNAIQWVEPKTSGNFLKRHDLAELDDWDYMPVGGEDFDESSFMLKPEDAIDWVTDSANIPPDLKTYLNTHDDVVISSTHHYVERDTEHKKDPAGKAGIYVWNLTFGHDPDFEGTGDEEAWEEAHKGNMYQIEVQEDIQYNIVLRDYERTMSIRDDHGLIDNSAPQGRSDLPDDALTLASSELIFESDPEIKDKAFDSSGTLKEDVGYAFWITEGGDSNPLLESLTGFALPSTEFSWSFQKGQVISESSAGGDTFGASVDAETGMLQYVIEISGTNIYGIFGD